MGCGLNKFEKFDEKRPGNIYSTLKRPHVETKIDVSYEYRYVDFTTIVQAQLPGSSAVRIASLRDLPEKLQELYQQGFTVVAIHPFVLYTEGNERIPQEEMFRVVLIKKTERNSICEQNTEEYCLEVEPCMSSDQQPDQKLIPDLVKRIEDAASQGSKFAGIVQGYYIPKELPYSLSDSLSQTSSPDFTAINKACSDAEDHTSADKKSDCTNGSTSPAKSRGNAEQSKTVDGLEVIEQQKAKSSPLDDVEQLEELNFNVSNEDVFVPDKITTQPTMPNNCISRKSEILALFNKPKTQQRYRKYYTVKIPMRITKDKNAIIGLEANWLEYMTDHFRKGCSLVNAVFYLGMVNDTSSEFTDGVFIFEDFPEQDPKTVKRYDAIVVEQWTSIEGFDVQADYMPLLTSLAVYGWQLTCVLPTPIVKTNRDGNVTTKQIVFMQRPTLPHKNKKKEPKFHLRFSKDERHSKHSRKGKGKVNSKDKETDRNKKNEEQTKTDDTVDIHGNHQTDGNILQKSEGVQEDLISQEKNEVVEETPLLRNANSSPLLEESSEDIKDEESRCTDGTKSMEVESADIGIASDGKQAENDASEGGVDTPLMENLQIDSKQ
ncbi:raftlin [Bufo gargarizans]|uniref:raftlin n=1 Tax=Bufo gargarizans TaxID=30331 RepID=UPI001CF5D48F|nr:raftlin [Bufo gargarizans]